MVFEYSFTLLYSGLRCSWRLTETVALAIVNTTPGFVAVSVFVSPKDEASGVDVHRNRVFAEFEL